MQTPRVREVRWIEDNRGFAWDQLGLAHTLLDSEAQEIFRQSSLEELTATQLSRLCRISIRRCYRWLDRLESLGLLVSRDGPVDRNGVRMRRYRSALRLISVRLEDDQIRTRIELSEGAIRLVSECTISIQGAESIPIPVVRRRLRTDGEDVVHVIDPPRGRLSSRRKIPINLPAFLEQPLSRLPERR